MPAEVGPLHSQHPARRVLIPQGPTLNISSCRSKASVSKSWWSSDRTNVTVRRQRLCPSLLAPEQGHLPEIHSACPEHSIPWVRPPVWHRHCRVAALCGRDSDCPCCSKKEALQTDHHNEVPLQTHHQNLSRSLNTFRSYMQQQAGDLQLDLGCASGLILQTPAKQSHSNFLVCLAPSSCQSSPGSPCRGRNSQSGAVTTPLPWELYISQWMAAMVPTGPARTGALRGLRPFPLRGAPAQSFNHPPMQSHQFSVCFYFGPPVATSWDGFLRAERGKKLPCCL